MIWEKEVKLIVMLCPLEGDNGREESVDYWKLWSPGSQNDERVRVIQCDESIPMPGVVVRQIVLQERDNTEEKIVTHVHMEHWKDDQAVTDDQMQALNFVIKAGLEVRQDPNKTVLVHCSAGIGRTGTYIALLLLIESIEYQRQQSGSALISIFGTVRRLREQRWLMVKKEKQ